MAKQVNGAVNKIDHLKSWFYDVKHPYWTLYKGNTDGSNSKLPIIVRNEDFDDLDDAWDMLQRNISMYETGLFTVLVKPKNTATSGAKINYSPGLSDDNGIAGVGAANGLYPVNHIGGINAIIDKEKKTWELEKKVEELEAAMNHKETFSEKIMGMLEANMPMLVENVFPLLINKLLGGTSQPVPTAAIAGTPGSINENEIIENALSRIALHFNLVEALPKLADWIDTNPELAKSFLK